MALKVASTNLGFQLSSCFASPKPSNSRKDRFVFRSTQVEQISFTQTENSLIEALLGIQGRGRSSSPQQLTVCLNFLQFVSQLIIH